MAATVRSTKTRIARRDIRAKIEEVTDRSSDHELRLTLRDETDDPDEPETWVYGIDDDREATLVRSTEHDDLAAEPEPPQWVQQALQMWDIQVAE